MRINESKTIDEVPQWIRHAPLSLTFMSFE